LESRRVLAKSFIIRPEVQAKWNQNDMDDSTMLLIMIWNLAISDLQQNPELRQHQRRALRGAGSNPEPNLTGSFRQGS